MRLIDADALLEHIKRLECHAHNLKYEQGLNDCLQCYFPQIIENQPTAYNLDAVVEQLDRKEIECFKNGSMGYLFPVYGEAKNIVRNGGKE